MKSADARVVNEAIKEKIVKGMCLLDDYDYGWGPHHDGLPLRPDVFSYVCTLLARDGDGAPYDFGTTEFNTLVMDERGSVMLVFEPGGGRTLELVVPCGGVVIARQKFDGQDSFIEGRLDTAPGVLAGQIAGLRAWIEGGP